uniref:Uncharacterized protein n=1 Tax=Arundo donax TaxID=35708 RepID=A0A0A9H330_ARUDO
MIPLSNAVSDFSTNGLPNPLDTTAPGADDSRILGTTTL